MTQPYSDQILRSATDAEVQQVLAAALRQDLGSFSQKVFATVSPADQFRHNWHLEVMAHYLSLCRTGQIKRLIITLPPRYLKSITASVAFPAWLLGHDPSQKIVCVSYSQDLAAKHARDCRSVMEAAWYQSLFPGTRLDAAKNAELEFMTTQRGFRLATSTGGTLTGRGGNIIIIDDPLKPQDALSDLKREAASQWYDNTLYSRLDNKREGVIIIVTQRLHLEDLVGHVLNQEDWVHISMPAIAEAEQTYDLGHDRRFVRPVGHVLHAEHEPLEILERTKEALGSYHFSAQYQQEPLPEGGNMIRWDWFRTYDEAPQRTLVDSYIHSWDTASKGSELSDYSVCTTWLIKKRDHGVEFYLINVERQRLDYPALKKLIIRKFEDERPNRVIIEDTVSGTCILQDLKQLGIPLVAFRPEGDKVMRMSAQSAKIEGGLVYIPERAPWLDDFKTEVLQFPHGRYDDQVDSMSQALGWFEHRNANKLRVRRVLI
jgi:predicted phage terminase large subunit-like protein